MSRLIEYYLIYLYLSAIIWAHVAIEPSVVTERAHFGREDRVKQLLDRSIFELPTETLGAYLTISRPAHINWQLLCASDTTNFTCSVHLENLFVFLYSPMPTDDTPIDTVSLTAAVALSNLAFTLTGEISASGTIRLRETHSYSATEIISSSSITNLCGQGLLTHIMQRYNAKLSIHQLGEYVTNHG